jgi:hypothetical protein
MPQTITLILKKSKLNNNDDDFPGAPPQSSSPPSEFHFDFPTSPPPEPTPEPHKRVRKPTAKARAAMEDLIPEGPGPVLEQDVPAPEPMLEVPSTPRNILLRVPNLVRTLVNSFRTFRLYINCPIAVPDMDIGLPDLVPEHASNVTDKSTRHSLAIPQHELVPFWQLVLERQS